MGVRERYKMLEGPLLVFVLLACSMGFTYIVKDYYDSTERNLLYSRIANARMDERKRASTDADKRVDDVRTYYQVVSKKRDDQVDTLIKKTDAALTVAQEAVDLIKDGQKDRKKALAVSQIAAVRATQSLAVASDTNKEIGKIVAKSTVSQGDVSKLNAKIKETNK